ncbi:MAG: hypothetical protein MRY60_10420 [Algiphilus sp.]|uniref:hypothetical protein n=1 Tax=Algiphilus sp. TaxID=1872431 RepID=UPI001CA771CD|nr:hypothetical protein [Algiphilus sp.]MCI5104177.1 hypothetical protein [Algiphilus sp.]
MLQVIELGDGFGALAFDPPDSFSKFASAHTSPWFNAQFRETVQQFLIVVHQDMNVCGAMISGGIRARHCEMRWRTGICNFALAA